MLTPSHQSTAIVAAGPSTAMTTPIVLIPRARIEHRVRQLGRVLTQRFAGRPLLLLSLLDGSVFFTTDLTRQIRAVELILHFARASSYNGECESSGRVELDDMPECAGLDVLMVDDILDTGRTLHRLGEELRNRGAASVTSCVMLDKPARREVPCRADLVGFTIPDVFVVGYGMDHGDRYRHLPDICRLGERLLHGSKGMEAHS